jgi:hypothetical protein
MQMFRAFVIGTLNIVAILLFIGAIIVGVLAGLQGGPDAAAQAGLPELPAAVWGVAGGVMGWLSASVGLGILFILIDIQDGIRDLHRDLTRQE